MKNFRPVCLFLAFLAVLSAWARRPDLEMLVKLSNSEPVTDPGEIKQYERFIKRYAPGEDAFVAVVRLAESLIRTDSWEEAAELYQSWRPLFTESSSDTSRWNTRFDAVVQILTAPAEEVAVTNLGPGVNTKNYEGFPVLSADGTRLYFTGKYRPDCLGGEDVFVSALKNGEWSKARNLGTQINTTGNESANSVTADGNVLVLFGEFWGGRGGGDNFYTELTSQGWGDIQRFPKSISGIFFDSDGFITADGKAMLFTSDRPGGAGEFHEKGKLFHGNFWGNTDIYVSVLTEDGWSEPINLGSGINTPYGERTPFLHPDGKTLYFSSDGLPGLGRMDVFKAERLSDTSWTDWSSPQNLGKEINTTGDDLGYKIATSGEKAYFSAYGGTQGLGGYDLYSVTLPGKARPEAVATIEGKVTDEEARPLEAVIKWEDLETGENVGQLKSNPQDGSYFIALPLGRNYGYYAEKEDFYPVSENIDLTEETEALDVTEDIVLVRMEMIKQGITVRINNIFFDFDRYELKPSSYPELNRLAEVLADNPGAKVEIAGHTDNVGTAAYNQELSDNRARAVVDYLASKGIEASRLIARGYGETRPVDTNDTEEGRTQNRRVEFKFLK